MKKRSFVMAVIGLAMILGGGRAAGDAKTTVEEVRRELMQLPYYGVFDFIAFSYDRGTLMLMGYAYHPGLSHDAEQAVRRASGIDTVINKIEELPASRMDDEARWKIYYKIYRDPFLSRYAPGGGVLWGSRRAFGPGFHRMNFALFPGMEPAGDYPIHIIVRNGRVTLLGVVDNESDKNVAGLRALEVPDTFGVKNDLQIERDAKSSPR